ncbi:peptide ligase PGM1-related protein [Micromonospora profundi]|uniref:preATP grasp domain-containing protein n=1 Tax=Micromonospora TaxID=1873 RepID=UPI0033BA7545
MSRIVIANVDSDAMCGNDMPPEIHALSSMCCCRLIVMAESEQDMVVVPHSISDEFIRYVNELLGRNLSARNVVVPRDGDEKQLILNDESLNDGYVAAEIRSRAGGSVAGWELETYFSDRAAVTLAEELQLAGAGPARNFLRAGGAETYNSKVLFRQLAEAIGAPVAEGRIAASERELAGAIAELMDRTGRVMVKQDLNSGSAGNTALTSFDEDVLTGASRVRRLTRGADVAEVARELWTEVAVQRNTRVVVEAYHFSQAVHYTEHYVHGPGRAPTLMNFGEMRMEPTFIGFEIPCQRLGPQDIGEMIAHATNLCREAGDRGFTGYMNVDSILTEDGQMLFTEVNGRMGDCTHIDYLARALVGDDYNRTHVVLTRNWLKATSFGATLKALGEAGVLFDHDTRSGVVIPIEDTDRSGTVDYMVIGHDAAHARDIEARTLDVLRAQTA